LPFAPVLEDQTIPTSTKVVEITRELLGRQS
jgi:hypothetical protein